MFHPIDDLAVELLLDGDVRHSGRGRCPVPVFFARREPDDITRANLLDGSAFALRPATACCDDERLPQRMCMPCSPGPRFEGHARALNKRGIGRLEQRINARVSSEPIGRTFCGWLRANSFNFHIIVLIDVYVRSRVLIARRSSIARYPSATWSSGRVKSKTFPGLIFSFSTRSISSGRYRRTGAGPPCRCTCAKKRPAPSRSTPCGTPT